MTEETDGDITVYIYDASGTVIGFEFYESDDILNPDNTWEVYWFEKNLQGEQREVTKGHHSKQLMFTSRQVKQKQ